MNRQEFTFPSATGVCEISACAYLPDTEPETVLVIHHGMAEHRKRYEDFICFLCGHGIAVYMHDMANHGESNKDIKEAGWFGEEDGWKRLTQDFCTMVQKAAADYPGKKLILTGHSMGSLLCRLYMVKHPEGGFDGAILLGTGGPNKAAGPGLLAAKMIAAVKGKRYRSPFLGKMAFGSYNKRFEGRTDYDWLTRETAAVDRYIADPSCGFLFTVQGMADLISANIAVNMPEWYIALPKELPVLLANGAEDPVGDYGAGVKAVAESLKAAGHEKVTLKLYPECRHEVLNETNRQEVMEDLLRWIEGVQVANTRKTV